MPMTVFLPQIIRFSDKAEKNNRLKQNVEKFEGAMAAASGYAAVAKLMLCLYFTFYHTDQHLTSYKSQRGTSECSKRESMASSKIIGIK